MHSDQPWVRFHHGLAPNSIRLHPYRHRVGFCNLVESSHYTNGPSVGMELNPSQNDKLDQ